MTTAILLNGDYEDDDFYRRQLDRAQQAVAADGGPRLLRRLGRWPRVLVGDFDSLPAELLNEAEAAGVEVLAHPVRKDETDAELAVAVAEERWPDEIVLLGALGGAFDHALGHLAVLRGLAGRGRRARIAAPSLAATVLWGPASILLAAPVGTRVSLLALTPDVVLTLRGFDYELVSTPLPASSCRGLGNRVAHAGAIITVVAGLALALVADGEETFSPMPDQLEADRAPRAARP